jgi:hypothetical protein
VGAGHKLGVSPFSARGKAQAAHELAQNFRCLVKPALRETAELVAAHSVREVVVLDGVAAGALPASVKGGECAHCYADVACDLK